MYRGRVGGYLGSLDVLQARLSHSAGAPGSTVVWVLWGLTALSHLSQRDQIKTDLKENNLFSASFCNRPSPPSLLSKPATFSSC